MYIHAPIIRVRLTHTKLKDHNDESQFNLPVHGYIVCMRHGGIAAYLGTA